jgi:uncharacterized protein YndB with AHSA1/START domain
VTAPLRFSFEVRCSAAHAFAVWTTRTSLWWPRSHTVSEAAGLEVVIEGRPGGRIFERTPAGAEHDWGEVTRWEPPRRLAYRWHLGASPAAATDVEITFSELDGATTRVDIVHGGWERLGAAGPGRRDGNRSGWNGVLPHFRAACAPIRPA